MKPTIKKSMILAVTLATTLALLVSAAICPIAAAESEQASPKTLLALGDSLTTGYGLENYVYDGDPYLCNSYINRVAAAMGLKGGDTYVNRAVNGDTSGNLVGRLPGMENDVKKAEMIVITIGGNDVLSLLPRIMNMIVDKEITNYEEAAELLESVDPEVYVDLIADPEFQGMIVGAIVKLNANLKTISDFIKEKAPDARVIFLKQYNPLYAPGFSDFAVVAQKCLDLVNDAIEKNGQTYGFDVVDVPSVINEGSAELTNILQYDIHPNEQGHLEIAKLLASHLGLSLDPAETAEETTEAPTETEEPTEAPTETAEPPATTEQPEETTRVPDGTETSAPAVPSGCQASVWGASALLTAVSAAFVLKKNRS